MNTSITVSVPVSRIINADHHCEHTHYGRDVNPVTFVLKGDTNFQTSTYLIADNPAELRAAADRLIELAAHWDGINAARRAITPTDTPETNELRTAGHVAEHGWPLQ